jgi:UDP-N-acetylmuramoyl-L-alanyl-D-glutamate--2,6-diaminopimelate ligase
VDLRTLIQDLPDARVIGPREALEREVRAVRDDSREVQPGDVFVAVKGLTVDGHAFARTAVERGATAIVVQDEQPGLGAAQIVVGDSARALGTLAARAAGRPSDAMVMIGITGTNGKTTTTYLLESILAAADARPGVIGTVSYRYAGRETPAPFTTPTPLALHDIFRAMREAGCTHGVMETSSAALSMARLEGVRFQAAAFSNLTQDHLDVHGTMAEYQKAKELLFRERLAADGVAVAMIDDPVGAEMLAAAPAGARKLRVSIKQHADVYVKQAQSSIAGIEATIGTPRGDIAIKSAALLGEYNIANLSLAIGVAEGLGVSHAAIVSGIERLAGVPGRVQRVANARGRNAFVDYAHTPDALERVIAALRPLTRGRLIVVFGCGGDRDRTKRPKMGAIVARDADLAVVTSDNPRTEEPRSIIDMILEGVRAERPKAEPIVDVDRRAAIRAAVAAAGADDVVLIAGKGHEDYQILGKTKIHFDDREEAAAAIAALP